MIKNVGVLLQTLYNTNSENFKMLFTNWLRYKGSDMTLNCYVPSRNNAYLLEKLENLWLQQFLRLTVVCIKFCIIIDANFVSTFEPLYFNQFSC